MQEHFDDYRHVYNRERPHQALNLEVPASRYQVSVRRFPEQLTPIEYDSGDIVRKVNGKGQLQYRGHYYSVGKAFYGYPVAVRATNQDGVFHVMFCHQKIAEIDLHSAGSVFERN